MSKETVKKEACRLTSMLSRSRAKRAAQADFQTTMNSASFKKESIARIF